MVVYDKTTGDFVAGICFLALKDALLQKCNRMWTDENYKRLTVVVVVVAVIIIIIQFSSC
jgi:hypothetical protein